ncbi:MAG: hypothetical protein ACQERZ_08840 [Fusobacteriota bacterium]
MQLTKKKIFIVLIFFLIGGFLIYKYILKNNEENVKSDSFLQNEYTINNTEKSDLEEEKEKILNEEKKYEGKKGDKSPAEVLELNQSGKIIDYSEGKFPEVFLKIKDISGVFRVRILFYYNEDKIGYSQKNPNTDKTDVEVNFSLNNKIILDDAKTFLDYEGATINYKIQVWDNNMNKSEIKGKENIKIIDNTKPQEGKVYWNYFFDETYDQYMYNNAKKNIFSIYKVYDLPLLEDNKISKYQIMIEDPDENLLFRAGFQPFEGEKKEVSLEISGDGKYILKLNIFDLNDNMSTKSIKFGIDRTKPVGELSLVDGVIYPRNKKIRVRLEAKDNLSGLFRYRVASSKEELQGASWKDFEDTFVMNSGSKMGFFDIWCQLEDNAFNRSTPIVASYYVNEDKNFNIKSKYKERERNIEVETEKDRDNKEIKIINVEEK